VDSVGRLTAAQEERHSFTKGTVGSNWEINGIGCATPIGTLDLHLGDGNETAIARLAHKSTGERDRD
jgi:hypothetical protein